MSYCKPLYAGVFFAFLSGCTPVKNKTGDRLESLNGYFHSQIPVDEPGGAFLVMKDEEIVFSRGYGIADVQTREPITPQTLFNLGSISKTFVSNAILMLQEQKKLSVDDDILKYFPDFKNKELARKIRIRHLLTHTSGLPDNRNVKSDTVFYMTAKDAENWAPVMQTDSIHFQPGERFEYSNPAFNALALIIEKVSGVKWQTFIIQNIMRPSGMLASTITDGPYPDSGVAHAYNFVNGNWSEDDYGEEPTFAASGNGGVWSSVEELAKYELALRHSVFLSKDAIADSRTVKTFANWKDNRGEQVGWSWFITQRGNLKIIGHTGDQGGFLCNYVTVPEKKIFFVILCNTRRNVDAFTAEIFKTLEESNWLD
jgi:CubicO group peptidase (beta-lactamase class C family)